MRALSKMVATLIVACAAGTAAATPLTTVIDIHRIPLGDGKVADSPQKGEVFSCMTRFRRNGARHAGGWIHGNTWDATEKITVRGHVEWPDAGFNVELVDEGGKEERVITGNGLPVGSETGEFPVAPSDPAFRIDRNPNSVREHRVDMTLPANPIIADRATCVPMGVVGYALNGVAFFNGLDDGGRDAVAHEVQDACDGHPQKRGIYHYHGPSPCIPHANEPVALVGYALDGFGIYSSYGANGRELTDADLDECHGRVSEIMWDGRRVK